jgi:APA family basic amino acid/polyamine antiporter
LRNDNLFVRNATGLVRSWSVFDAFIYAFFSINLVTLGFYIFSFSVWLPDAHMIPAMIIAAIFLIFMIVVYASMISIIPRSGGDYIWQSRILGSGIGFVVAFTGWVVILWHWVPLYGTMLCWNVYQPFLAILSEISGSESFVNAALWLNTQAGVLFCCVSVIVLASIIISFGMRWYARFQKFCFFVAIGGFILMLALLLLKTNAQFIAGFNHYVSSIFGGDSVNAYQQILTQTAADGYTPVAWSNMAIIPSLALIPMLLFWNMWANWGATLYGEIRGAGEFRLNLTGMVSALIGVTVLAIIFFAILNKSVGWEWFHAANYAFYMGDSPLPIFPYPALLASFLTDSALLQLILIVAMSAWFFGWCGTVFLSSTRVIFAAAFDRLLPEWISRVSPKTRSPINALMVMAVPSLIVSTIYAYSESFVEWTLATTLVISVTYVFTAIAAVILPYKHKEMYESSPVAKYKVLGIPLITICGVVFLAFMAWVFKAWLIEDVYGLANVKSYMYMGVLYLISLIVYISAKGLRKKQGIDLEKIYGEIPVE